MAKLSKRMKSIAAKADRTKLHSLADAIALVKEGDSVTIDAHKLLIQLNVPDDEIARRRAAWKQPAPRYTRGVLAKYAKLVGTASKGAVTD